MDEHDHLDLEREKPPMHRLTRKVAGSMWLLAAACTLSAQAQQSDEELARAAQNPLASLISVPFQNNTNFKVGPKGQTQNVLNIQPVIPVNVNSDWNLITRTIVPLISQPDFGVPGADKVGIGDIQFSAFFSPTNPSASGWLWGVGPVVQLRTASNDVLGQGKWGLGATGVALRLQKGSPWVYGALVNNIWSVRGDKARPDVNQMLVQPFVNYNFPDYPGRYLSFSPVITANWKADSRNVWTVPIGLGVGQIFRIGQQPVNGSIAAYKNVGRPDGAADWTLRVQLQLMFPK